MTKDNEMSLEDVAAEFVITTEQLALMTEKLEKLGALTVTHAHPHNNAVVKVRVTDKE